MGVLFISGVCAEKAVGCRDGTGTLLGTSQAGVICLSIGYLALGFHKEDLVEESTSKLYPEQVVKPSDAE